MKNAFIFAALLCLGGPVRAEPLSGDAAFASGDYGAAYQAWSRAAEDGDASAMAALGVLYDTGHGVPQDYAAALQWYRRAAELGNVRGMFNVGAMYDNGRGTSVDRAEALRWYDKAAENGYARAAYAAGLMVRDGDGVARDRKAAIRYFQMAARGGLEAARANLATLQAFAPPRTGAMTAALTQRDRVPADEAAQVAIMSLQLAMLMRQPLDAAGIAKVSRLAPTFAGEAASGARVGQYDAGYTYEHGYGVPRDPVRSYVFYLRATASSQQTVKEAALHGAAEVARTLSPAQHQAARDMLLDAPH